MATTALIVDDHAAFRSFARLLLESEGFDVVGEAGDGASAVSAVHTLRPQVVLLDVQLPDALGFDVARKLLVNDPATSVVLVSSRDAADYGDQIESSGALGFIPKAELSGAALRDLLAEVGQR
jgi:DNA-binding NarL/FixJ family response regulator